MADQQGYDQFFVLASILAFSGAVGYAAMYLNSSPKEAAKKISEDPLFAKKSSVVVANDKSKKPAASKAKEGPQKQFQSKASQKVAGKLAPKTQTKPVVPAASPVSSEARKPSPSTPLVMETNDAPLEDFLKLGDHTPSPPRFVVAADVIATPIPLAAAVIASSVEPVVETASKAIPFSAEPEPQATSSVISDYGNEDDWSVPKSKSRLPLSKASSIASSDNYKGSEVENTTPVFIDCEEFIKNIIGQKGETINSIRDKSGASLSFDKDSTLRITGTAEQKSNAKSLVMEILKPLQLKRDCSTSVDIHFTMPIGSLMGKGGENIKNITTECDGVRIDIQKEKNILTISGLVQNVQLAEAMVRKILAGPPPPESTQTAQWTTTNQLEAIFGEKGANLKAIRQISKAKVDIDKATQSITVAGDAVDADKTFAAIRNILKTHENVQNVGLLSYELALFNADKYAPLNKISQEFNVVATIAAGTTEKPFSIILSGEPANLAAAVQKVETILNTPPEPVIPEGEVMQEIDCGAHTSKVIGAGGSNIKLLSTDFNVKIEVIKINNTCRVIGVEENVISAVRSIKKMMENLNLIRAKTEQIEKKFASSPAVATPATPASSPSSPFASASLPVVAQTYEHPHGDSAPIYW